jgi:non-structural maintenance of chromosomes element 4
VKQTSDATIDSRLLVETADLSFRKAKSLTLGDSSVGIDMDDFVSRCIAFMKRGDREPGAETQNTQRRRQGEEDEEETGDTMNWAYLGRNAAFLYNRRPCLSGFMLGPLSVQKKVRQQTQRRAKEAKNAPSQLLRPIELTEEDLEKQESANLSQICTEIAGVLRRTVQKRHQLLEDEWNNQSEEGDEVVQRLTRKHGLCSTGGVSLFEFCVNPKSFGQTVENMFYVSFLLKESSAALVLDDNALPTLLPAQRRTVAERQEARRNQAVFTLSFDIWEQLIETFGIEKSIIPHRKDEVYEDGVLQNNPDDEAVGENGSDRELDEIFDEDDGVDLGAEDGGGVDATGTMMAEDEDSDMYG